MTGFTKTNLMSIFSSLRDADLKYLMHCNSLMVQCSPTKLTVYGRLQKKSTFCDSNYVSVTK